MNPNTEEVERFIGNALALQAPVSARALAAPVPVTVPAAVRTSSAWQMPAALAAGIVLGAIGLSFYHQSTDSHAVSATNAPPWKATVARCQKASGETTGCELFADAARYQVSGDSKTAHQLITRGLERTGVSAPVIAQVQKTLQTPPASPQERSRAIAQASAAASAVVSTPNPDATQWLTAAQLHVAAGQSSEAYVALGHYLKDSIPHQQSAAYIMGFAQPVTQIANSDTSSDSLTSTQPHADPKDTVASSNP